MNMKQGGNVKKLPADVIHERKPARGNGEVAEDKLLSYFFLSVTYGNERRRSGAMNGA